MGVFKITSKIALFVSVQDRAVVRGSDKVQITTTDS